MPNLLANAGHLVKHASIGDFVEEKVPSLKSFLNKGNADQEYNIPSLSALSSAMRLLQRSKLLDLIPLRFKFLQDEVLQLWF